MRRWLLSNVIAERLESRWLLSSYTFNAQSFESGVGTIPSSNLVADSAGNLYGTLSQGGSVSDGAIFEFAKGSHAPTLLTSFDNATSGSAPSGAIAIDAAGNLFGTTRSGGGAFAGNDKSAGTIFELPRGQSAIQTLFSFGDFAALPNGVTLDPATGDLYVTTTAGGAGYNQASGAAGVGGVYKLPGGSHTLTSLAAFDAPSTGASPRAAVTLDSQGNLFGTASAGGAGVTPGGTSGNGYGTVFEIPSGTTLIIAVAAFSGDNGSRPIAPLVIDAAGNLFGETSQGGASFVANGSSQPGFGDVFKIAAGDNAIDVVASFNNANGSSPLGGLISDAAGNLFGTTYQGGDANAGTVFEIPAGSASITSLHSFTPSGASGSSPSQSVYFDPAGNLWGVTESGGEQGQFGVLFQLSTNGTNPFQLPGGLSATLLKTTLPTSAIAGPHLIKTAAVRVTNTTAAAVKGRATVKLYLSADGSVDSASIPIGTWTQSVNLKANASAQVSVPINFIASAPTATTFSIIARVIDPSKLPADTVTLRTLELSPAVLSFDLLNLTVSPASTKPGQRVTFSLTLKNTGNISNAQAKSPVDRRIHGTVTLSPGQIPPIAFSVAATVLPGKTKTLKFSAAISKGAAAGLYAMTIVVAGATSDLSASQNLTVQ